MERHFVMIDGLVHLALPHNDNVVCYTATFDTADSEGDESLRWHETNSKVVTCPECALIIALCRGVRTRVA